MPASGGGRKPEPERDRLSNIDWMVGEKIRKVIAEEIPARPGTMPPLSPCQPAMRPEDFHYDLPEELIAREPPPQRRDARLLHLDGNVRHDRRFVDLPGLVVPGDVMVFNDTRVLKARLFGRKDSGGRVEVLVERLLDTQRAQVLVRASKSPRPGVLIHLDGGDTARMLERRDECFVLEFSRPVLEILEQWGELPLPPYLERAPRPEDLNRYQTVYARQPGAVAAPTAGLHFDDAMLARLDELGVTRAFVTLHVGAGTFTPVRTDDVREHVMHAEVYDVPQATVDAVAAARARGGRVLAVGTTSLRALEAAAAEGRLCPGSGETRLFILPGYRFRVVDRLLTNFHLPRSTLLMLVSALAGPEAILTAYRHAVAERYRFFSYGDAMLIEGQTHT